jgi:hypothetical protein
VSECRPRGEADEVPGYRARGFKAVKIRVRDLDEPTRLVADARAARLYV